MYRLGLRFVFLLIFSLLPMQKAFSEVSLDMGAITAENSSSSAAYLASIKQSKAGAIAAKTSDWLKEKCSSGIVGPLVCAAAVSEGVASIQSFISSRKNKNVARDISNNGDGSQSTNPYADFSTEDPPSDEEFNNAVSQETRDLVGPIPNPFRIVRDLQNIGFESQADGSVTTPSGKVATPSEISDAIQRDATGELASGKKELEKLAKKLARNSKKSIYRRSTGGASGARGVASSRRSSAKKYKSKKYGFKFPNLKAKRKLAQSVETKDVKGTPIIYKGSDLFDVVASDYYEIIQTKTLDNTTK